MFKCLKWVSEKKKTKQNKDLECVSQLCNTIKVQSTGPQVEVSMDYVQGHTHTHERMHVHLSSFFSLEASGTFSGKKML